MPINVSENLPAINILESENIFVMSNKRAVSQDIRPLKIIILNLMPTKIETETQLLRLLGNSPLQIDIELLQTATHKSKNTSPKHLTTFYKTFSQIKNNRYDGMIITGAPVELLDFEEVDYWEEICEIMEWSKKHVYSTLHICWGAQAGLYFHYGIQKHKLKNKLSGVYSHKVIKEFHPLMRGFDDTFKMPHSRYTGIKAKDLEKIKELEILSISDIAGPSIIADKKGRQFFITGHVEYDRDTLAKEYFRDMSKGIKPDIPENYFPYDNPGKIPKMQWRSTGSLIFINWLNYYVYQETPYNLNDIK